MSDLHYYPSPTLKRFHHSDAFVRGCRGPIGSGKSTACALEIVRRAAMQEPCVDGVRRSRWVVVRNTYVELRDTTMKTWDQWCGTMGTWKHAENVFEFKDADIECEVLFRALDRPNDVKKLLSLELTGAWINEAREIPRNVMDMVQGRVGRYPAKMQGGPTWYGLIMDTNPPDNDHWWHRLFEDEIPDGWEQFVQPGGLSDAAENLEYLPGGKQYYTRLMPGKDPEWIKVYVHGEYGMVMDGKPVYPGYRDSIHCVEVEPLKGPPIVIGMDFGLTPAATFWQVDARGRWICLDELVTDNMAAKEFGQTVLRHMQSVPHLAGKTYRAWGDPAGEQRAQTDETTVFQILNASGLRCARAPTNDFLKRTEAVSQALSRLIDGVPGVRVHPRCKRLRKALAGGYCYKRLQTSDEKYRDVPDKNEHSHVAESAQYAFIGEGEGGAIMQPAGSRYEPVTMSKDWSVFS